MKQSIRILVFVLVLSTLLVSACGGVAASASDTLAGSKVNAAPVEFTGVIEAINGNQWTVNGQTITVDPAVVRDGPFNVGDTVKVEVDIQTDGSIVVTRVEIPAAGAVASESSEAKSSETPESESTPDPATGGLIFDDNGNEAFGTVDSIDGSAVVIGGQTFQISNGAEFKDQIAAGNFVKVHFTLNADGTMSITEIELADPGMIGDDSIENSDDDDSINDGNDDSDDDDNSSGSGQGDDHGDDDDDSGSGGGDNGNSGSGDD